MTPITYVLEVLFSSRKGLFPWSPVLVFSAVGLLLFAIRNKLQGAILLTLLFTLLLLNVYINSSQWDWWGATAFGARRFSNCTIIFCAGFAMFYSFLKERWKTVGATIGVLVLAASINLNLFLTRSYRRGRLQYEHADRFSDILKGKLYPAYKYVIYPLQFPVQLYYHLAYGIKLYHPENEFFIGEDVIYFQQRHGNLVTGEFNPLFGQGWERKEQMEGDNPFRLSTGTTCVLNLPLFFMYDTNLTMEMQLRTTDVSDKNIWVDLYLNDSFLVSKKISPNGKNFLVKLYEYPYRKNVNSLTLHVYKKSSDYARSHSRASPVVALQSLQFRATKFRKPSTITQ